jgi:hypothetical protein
MAEMGYGYASIVKSEKQVDGTLKVYGKATDETLDVDQQICDNDWLRKAMPDWFVSGGNIREQHSNIAAGVATDYEEKADGHYIQALVVDPVSVKKVEAGVLQGFSIGIRGPRVIRDVKAAGGRIVDGQIVEISLVDRPANPSAKMTIAKAMESGELMAVDQTMIPSPSELASSSWAAKSVEPETPIEEAAPVVVDEVEAEAVEAPAEAVEAPVEAPADEVEVSAETQILEAAKGLLATVNKFDQGAFDTAVGGIADLISVEAQEMKEGHDERASIKELLRAAKHLAHWYEGEVAEGEVPGVTPDQPSLEEAGIFLSADAEEENKMCDKCNKSVDECMCDVAKSVTVDDEQVNLIISKAVASAKASVTDEIAALTTALEAEKAKASKLEQDLEGAMAKAATGGPKRTATEKPLLTTNDFFAKAVEYRAKAAATEDKVLADGYKAMAEDFEAKARKDK